MDRIMTALKPMPALLALLLAALFAAPASAGFEGSPIRGAAGAGANAAGTALPVSESPAVQPVFASDPTDEAGPDDPPRPPAAMRDFVRLPDTKDIRPADAPARARHAGPYQARAPPAA